MVVLLVTWMLEDVLRVASNTDSDDLVVLLLGRMATVVWDGEAVGDGGFDFITRPRFEKVCRMDLNTDLRDSRAGAGLRGAMMVLSVGWVVEYVGEGEDG
jgi:hypothetical protein